MTNCYLIVEELESPVLQILECCRFRLPRQFCEGLRRTLEEVTGAVVMWKLDRLWKRSALCGHLHVNLNKISYDEVTGAGG